MGRVHGLLALHRSLHGRQGRPYQYVSDVLRGASVLAAGALDGLILEMFVDAAPIAARRGLLGPGATKWVSEDPTRILIAFASDEPHGHMAVLFRDNLARTTFQKAQAIEGALQNLLAADPPWGFAAGQLGPDWTVEDVRQTLDDFIARRDRIAHSGDQRPDARGATPIQRSWVETGVRVIDAIGMGVIDSVERRVAPPTA